MIPTVAECFQLMDRYRMLDNIRDHSIIVARVSALLAEAAIEAGRELSLPLTVASALLHDIGKTACLDNDCDHADLGRKICLENGLDEGLAEIVADHVRLPDFTVTDITEKKIVYYADKRVTHERVVDLGERQEYIFERYGNNDPVWLEKIRRNSSRWWQIEETLFAVLPFSPDEINSLIDTDPATCDLYLKNIPEAAKPHQRMPSQ